MYFWQSDCRMRLQHGSLRLTISDQITMEDADYVVDNLKEIVNHLREMSPLYEDFIKKTNNIKRKQVYVMYSEKVMDHFSTREM